MPEESEAVAVAVAVAGAGAGAGAPCGACRTLRRRCVPGCVFAPYFTAEDFAAVHSVFGASNASKMLEGVEQPEERRVAAATLIEEAKARARDPTFGRISYVRILQEVNDKARKQVDEAREEIAREFGALAASEPVDVAAAAPAVRVEARAQVDAALEHAREQDARLLVVRNANEVRWRELHSAATGTGNHAGNGTGLDGKRHRGPSLSEQTVPMPRATKQRRSPRPPGFSDKQMAVAEAEREKALLMRQAAPAKQNGHHVAAQHGETEPPRVTEVCGHGQMQQQMSEASREEAMRSMQPPAPAPQHLDSAGQRHAGDAAAGRTPGQGSTSVLLEAMMQLAGATGEQHQQQHLLVVQHAENGHEITQEMMQLQAESLDMAELARNQQIMKSEVMTEIAQWDAAAWGAMEHGVMTTMQQIPSNTWQHQDPAPQYAGMRDWSHEMPQQMEEASTAELAKTTTGNMSQQFAWVQQYQYHDPAAAHHASPWHQQIMAEAHQPAAASQVASEQDMLLLLQQHQVAAAELLSAGGARQFDSLAAQYDDTELTLGYGYGHPHIMHQQVAAAGQVAGVQDMNSRHATAAALAEREMMQLAAGAQPQHHAQEELDIALGNGHPDAQTQAMLQELVDIVKLAGERKRIREQGVTTTGMGQWEPNVMRTTQQDPDSAWLLEKLEQLEKASMPDLAKRLEMMSRQAEARRHAQKELGISLGSGHLDGSTQGILQEQEVFAMTEKERKLEMLMSRLAAAGRAREQKERKLEMLMSQVAAAGRAREQELIAQQAAAAAQAQQQQQQQHPVAQQNSGTELDISPGQGQPYWQLPPVYQMLQEKQLADAVGFGWHQPSTTLVQPDAAYANGEHGGGGAGAAMAFLSPGSAKDGPFLVDQQPQPIGHLMDSSLPPSFSQLQAQVSHQQRTDGGGQRLNSDLAAYLHYESLSRHGLAGNGRPQQGRGSEGSGEEMRQLSETDEGFASEVPILRIC